MKQIRDSPFRDRLVKIFSKRDATSMAFDEFVDMCSAFHPRASVEIKSRVAFFLFDEDSRDQKLTLDDITSTLSMMVDCGQEKSIMNEQTMQETAKRMFNEADANSDSVLSLQEFQRICSRVPEFKKKFSFKVV